MINLVLCLLSTRQFLTAEQIRRSVAGYETDDTSERGDDAFKRMFERDKAELRDLGVPLETGRTSIFDVDDGYRIARRDYELPEIEFDPAEAAAVGLASRLWQSATLSSTARTAALKLRAGGVELDDAGPATAAPETLGPLDAESDLGPLLEAVADQRAVSFGYRKSGAAAAQMRSVEPWGVLSWLGRWYLVGYDRARQDTRSFRLSRIDGAIRPVGGAGTVARPHGLDLVEFVRGAAPERTYTATVTVVGSGAARLRRMARPAASESPDAGRASASGQVDATADELTIDYTDMNWLARQIAAAGTSVRVTSPPELVGAVVALLRDAAGLAVPR